MFCFSFKNLEKVCSRAWKLLVLQNKGRRVDLSPDLTVCSTTQNGWRLIRAKKQNLLIQMSIVQQHLVTQKGSKECTLKEMEIITIYLFKKVSHTWSLSVGFKSTFRKRQVITGVTETTVVKRMMSQTFICPKEFQAFPISTEKENILILENQVDDDCLQLWEILSYFKSFCWHLFLVQYNWIFLAIQKGSLKKNKKIK